MSASKQSTVEELARGLDECETLQDALEMLTPDPDHTLRDAIARMATALAITGDESISLQFGPVVVTVSNLDLDVSSDDADDE